MRFLVSFLFFFITLAYVFPQKNRISPEDYINTYKNIAISEMKRSGIPASITLAQGMIESENGNSDLTLKTNNHFGIKCHSWNGGKEYHDDDQKNECFRKYDSAGQSFKDHTDFLMNTNRYAFLFEYKSTDYKSWAKGLKKAGYATNPSYPNILIKTIEDNELQKFDEGIATVSRTKTIKPGRRQGKEQSDNFTVDINKRKALTRNGVDYILVKKGDTFDKIADELGMMYWELPKYNDLTKDSALREGQELYIQPKRWRAAKGFDIHITEKGETMYSISQMYAVKLRRLYRRNKMERGTQPVEGQKIWLRRRKKGD